MLKGFYSACSEGVEYSNFQLNIDKTALWSIQRNSKSEVCVNGDSYSLSFSIKRGLLLAVLLTRVCRPLWPMKQIRRYPLNRRLAKLHRRSERTDEWALSPPGMEPRPSCRLVRILFIVRNKITGY